MHTMIADTNIRMAPIADMITVAGTTMHTPAATITGTTTAGRHGGTW
jgi:hypothetical protein